MRCKTLFTGTKKIRKNLVCKTGLIISVFWAVAGVCHAQQRPVYTQHVFNMLVLNPAYAGNQPQVKVSAIHRDQWVNLDGAPKTTSLVADIGLHDLRMGAGFFIIQDLIGVHHDYAVYGSYSYFLPMREGKLAMGMQVGLNMLNSDYTRLSVLDPDQLFTATIRSADPNFGFGLFWDNEVTYLGFSIPYLLNNRLYEQAGFALRARKKRSYYLQAGKIFRIGYSLHFKPSILLRYQEGQPLGFDLLTDFFLDEMVIFGAGFRSGDAFFGHFEVVINESLRIGYSYDKTISNLGRFTPGTHEFVLTYTFRMDRHQQCHTYF